jgi:hypothetical protein
LSWQWRDWNFDDSCIVYRIVSNLISGHGWAFNPGDLHNASTSVLNTIFIALVSLTGIPIPVSAHIIGGISIYFACCLIYKYLYETYNRPFIALLGGGLTGWIMAANLTWGLETNLFIALVIAVSTLKKPWIRWLFFGFAVLARPDAILIGFFLLIVDIKKYRRPQIFPMALAFFIILPWIIYSLIMFHQIFPDTLANKMWQGRAGYWGTGLVYLDACFLKYNVLKSWYFLSLFITFIGGVLLSAKRGRLLFVLISFVCSQQLAYMVLNVPCYHWYTTLPDVVLIVMLFVFICEMSEIVISFLNKHLNSLYGMFFKYRNNILLSCHVIIAVVLLGFIFKSYDVHHIDVRDMEYTATIKAIDNDFGEGALATVEVGSFGYYTQRKIIDIVGLTSSEPQFISTDNMDRFFTIAPEYILLHDPAWLFAKSIMDDPRFEKTYYLAKKYPQTYLSMQLYKKKK